jgi:hypothetical protein
MNQVAIILGIELPLLKARDVVMKKNKCSSFADRPISIISHRDSLLLLGTQKDKSSANDDDTASTSSCSDSDSSFSSSGALGVTFAEPLITEVITRPYTTINEKYQLFYNDYDYAEFRREAYGLGRKRLVSFSTDIVSDVVILPPVEDNSVMYYSEKELQR